MKIFEIAWLSIAAVSLILTCYHLLSDRKHDTPYPYLILVFALALIMFFIKRSARKHMERRASTVSENRENQQHDNGN
jgi:FtsH-binding integral membrane protein